MEFKGIQLTSEAANSARNLQIEQPENATKFLRLYLDGKGCDGFFYGVTFDEASPNDLKFESHGMTLLVDPDTIEFVDGSTVEWVDDERGRGFLVENPNHKKFRGKFYKKSAWQQKLGEKVQGRQPNSSN